MRKQHIAAGVIASALVAAAAIAGCSSGGGSSVLPGGGGGNPSPNPSPSPTPVLMGTMNVAQSGVFPNQVDGALPNAFTEFSCGCTSVAGTGTTDGSGNFTLQTQTTPEPNPSPLYTMVPGRNYIVITTNGGSPGGINNAAQAWTIIYAGNVSGHDHYLAGTNTSDVFTAAVALYVYWNSTFGSNNQNPAFDHWNFNDLAALYTHFQTSPNAPETQLFSDIVAQQELPVSIYPSKPGWNANQKINTTIRTDLTHVMSSGDVALPSPCPTPGGILTCANPTPTP
jgi:hypothetical protein